MDIHDSKILILDFGSQITQLIARRIRGLNVYCEIHPYDVSEELITKFRPKGIILSGGPNSVTQLNAPIAPPIIFELNVPILGICYGMQTIAKQFGGEVYNSGSGEFGYAEIHTIKGPLFADLKDGSDSRGDYLKVWMSHGDHVIKLPNDFEVIAQTNECEIAAIANFSRNIYAVQFHPEVTHTLQGQQIIQRFVVDICQCTQCWTMPNFIEQAINEIRQKVGSDNVILGLSGGVDSTVTGALIHRAITNQLTCIFVDTGLLRYAEATTVINDYRENLGLNIIKVDAKEEFYFALAGISDPEEKRKIIGRVFIEIFERQAQLLPQAKWLAQGTIYPDVIESAAVNNKAHSIKSHHNVGGLPENLQFKLLEPLRELFKDEVRLLGDVLQLNKNLIYRHPFPGPGLGVRIIGPIQPEFVELLQKADYIFIDELKKANLYHTIAQAFAVFLPIKTVGVMGDSRTYEHVIALRAVETTDFMSANVANLPFAFITKVANRIINEVRGINRVVYDISGKPPATIEWE